MAQFGGGKAPPPWQTRTQSALQNSLLGQHPNTTAISNQQLLLGAPQPPQYASVQQSMIQPPGLGSLQPIPSQNAQQQNLAQTTMQSANICPANLGQQVQSSQTSIGQTVALLGQPPLNSQSLIAHTQLSSLPQMQPQVTTVAYPPPRPAIFTTQGNPSNIPGSAIPGQSMLAGIPQVPSMTTISTSGNHPPPKQRVFTGTITKFCADFGFVDEDVFFQTSCVKGIAPKMGDRVLVEASYNPNMPFKWNGNRVQVIPAPLNATSSNSNRAISQSNFTGRGSGYNAVPPPYSGDPTLRASGGRRSRSPRRDRRDDMKRRDTRLDREDKDSKRDNRKRSRSRDRSRSPRRRPRLTPRYNVQIPKIMIHIKEANVLELRKRYNNLYIPSDVFLARPLWSDTFPAHRGFQFPRPTSFHILSKEVASPIETTALYDPPDINHSYAAKVMLMGVPSMEDIYKRSCALSEDQGTSRAGFVHPTRLIHFLVGLKGKNETMAIGGYWSPSLDGANPENNVNTLIRTAIRTCKALTGIDLAACTTWHRIAEIHYRRGESTHKGRTVPARVETTVIFVPDVWNLCPPKLEWDVMQTTYKQQLDKRLQSVSSLEEESKPLDAADAEQDEDAGEKGEEQKDPSHWASLDPKTMKVVDLRDELNARLQNSKGLKSQLIARLTKGLKAEQEKEKLAKESPDNMEIEENVSKDEEDKKKEDERKEDERVKAEEKERTLLEKRYTLPEQPMILVHPSRTAKSGKFDCTIMSLSVLLDYRQEDNKEHSFEVSLFAELFNEMLMRDFSFRIYRALTEAPEKKQDERKDRDKKKDDDKRDKKLSKDDDKKTDKEPDKKVEKEDDDKKDEEVEDEEIDEDFYEEIDEDDSKDGSKADKDKKKDDPKKDKERKEKKERKKMVTVDPHLLLSFVYFDQTHTGYIFDKDVEDIINLLGVNLSRAQLKKLVSPFLSRDALHYRRLTDVSLEDKDNAPKVATGLDLEQLAKGNSVLLPEVLDVQSRKSVQASHAKEAGHSKGVVEYEGSLMDIGQLVNLLERSEKARIDTEERLNEIQKELSTSKDDAKKSSEKISKLTKETKTNQVDLKSTEEELKKVLEDNGVYQKALQQIKGVIQPLFVGVDDSIDIQEVPMKFEQNGV